MSNKNPKAASLTNSNEKRLTVNAAKKLVSEFERLLGSERQLLEQGQADGLQAIAEAKQAVISQLSSIESSLIKMFTESAAQEDVQHLKERLLRCRSDNRSNHDLVLLELKHTNNSLELLRSVLKMDDLALYSQRGEVDMKREKRKFGSA